VKTFAKKLGIAHIIGDFDEQNSISHQKFLLDLDSILSQKASFPVLRNLQDLKVRITRNISSIELDRENGMIIPPSSNLSPRYMIEQIRDHEEELVREYRYHQMELDQVQKLILEVKRTLRIKKFGFDVEPYQVGICCKKLLRHQERVGSYLYGLKLYLSDHFELKPDGTMVLYWNFEV
jgi:hypothetical protein